MPKMNGHQAAGDVESSAGGDCPPNVAVTGRVLSGDHERAMDFGGSGRIETPAAARPFVIPFAQTLPDKGGPP
jgi:CheY-like chemotaxis protein